MSMTTCVVKEKKLWGISKEIDVLSEICFPQQREKYVFLSKGKMGICYPKWLFAAK